MYIFTVSTLERNVIVVYIDYAVRAKNYVRFRYGKCTHKKHLKGLRFILYFGKKRASGGRSRPVLLNFRK